jgi:hypothetical protein
MSPSVFNFFRPGYTPQRPDAPSALVAPEMQLVNEATVVGYFNAVQDLLVNGIGPSATSLDRNVTLQLADQRAIAHDATALVDHVGDRLKGGAMIGAIGSIKVPALNAAKSNTAEINSALNRRVWAAILLVAVSPEFLVTK